MVRGIVGRVSSGLRTIRRRGSVACEARETKPAYKTLQQHGLQGQKLNLVAKTLVLCKTIEATQPPARSTPCESRDAPEDDDSADPRGHAEQTRAEEERGLHCMETADADDQSF